MFHGKSFVLEADHSPLFSIYGSKKDITEKTENRLQRWGTLLLDYDFRMEYIPSKELGDVDGPFSLITKFNGPYEDTVITSLRPENEIKIV